MDKVSALKKEGLKGSFWNFLNIIVNQLRNFVVSLVLARLLSPAEFGLISMALVLNAILEIVIEFGLSNALIREKEISQQQISTVFYLNIGLGFLTSLLVFALAPGFAWFFKMPQLSGIVRVTSWSFFIASFGTLQTALFQRNLNFKSPFIARVVSGTASGCVGIVCAFTGFGVWSLVWMQLTGWTLNSGTIWWLSSWRPSRCFQLKSIGKFLVFGWKFTLTTIISRVFTQIDQIIIGKLYSAATLGLFNRAKSLNYLVTECSFNPIRSVMLPTLSKLQDDKEAFRYSLLKLINVVSFLSFLFGGIMYICSDAFILILYGEKWMGTVAIFRILGLFSFTMSLPIIYDTVMTAFNRMNLYLSVSIIQKAMLLGIIPIGIFWGFFPYLWGICFVQALGLLIFPFTARSCVQLSIRSQAAAFMPYMLEMLVLIAIWHLICFDCHSILLKLAIEIAYYGIGYLGMNILLRSDGFHTVWSIVSKADFRKMLHLRR